MTNKNFVFLHDCRIDLSVGLYDFEKDRPQPLLISVDAEIGQNERFADMAEATTARTLDYGKLHAYVTKELAQFGHIYLLEAVAEKIADFCLQFGCVQVVTIDVAKTSIFPEVAATGVRISRIRK